MKRDDVERFAQLARIALKDGEADAFAHDLSSILDYVSEVNEITGNTAAEKKVGALANVMREDGEPTPPGTYTEAILKAAPEHAGQYIKVKKILGDK